MDGINEEGIKYYLGDRKIGDLLRKAGHYSVASSWDAAGPNEFIMAALLASYPQAFKDMLVAFEKESELEGDEFATQRARDLKAIIGELHE